MEGREEQQRAARAWDRRFVPGVTAGICRRPIDRPRAGTHPPNLSMNVHLVNSPRTVALALAFAAAPEESWRYCVFSAGPDFGSRSLTAAVYRPDVANALASPFFREHRGILNPVVSKVKEACRFDGYRS